MIPLFSVLPHFHIRMALQHIGKRMNEQKLTASREGRGLPYSTKATANRTGQNIAICHDIQA
jgi:hypothetical protein